MVHKRDHIFGVAFDVDSSTLTCSWHYIGSSVVLQYQLLFLIRAYSTQNVQAFEIKHHGYFITTETITLFLIIRTFSIFFQLESILILLVLRVVTLIFYKNNRFFWSESGSQHFDKVREIMVLIFASKIRTIVLVTNRNESHLVLFSDFFPLILFFFAFFTFFSFFI